MRKKKKAITGNPEHYSTIYRESGSDRGGESETDKVETNEKANNSNENLVPD